MDYRRFQSRRRSSPATPTNVTRSVNTTSSPRSPPTSWARSRTSTTSNGPTRAGRGQLGQLPGHGHSVELHRHVHDLMRGVGGNKPFMLMEQTPNQQNWFPFCKVKRPGEVRKLSWQAVAHGADTVQFFQMSSRSAAANVSMARSSRTMAPKIPAPSGDCRVRRRAGARRQCRPWEARSRESRHHVRLVRATGRSKAASDRPRLLRTRTRCTVSTVCSTSATCRRHDREHHDAR